MPEGAHGGCCSRKEFGTPRRAVGGPYGGSVLDQTCGGVIAERFGLGAHASLNGPVAFGRLGEIWQLDAEGGRFAVKRAQFAVSVEAAELDAAYQERVRVAGVPMPAVIRAVEGSVLSDVGGDQVRVYE